MKRNILFTAFTIAVVLLLSACSKDSGTDPDRRIPEDLTAPYIAMKVDGKWWISEKSKNPKGFFSVTSLKSSNTPQHSITLHATSTNNFDKKFESLVLSLNIPAQVKVGTYTFPMGNNDYSILMGYFVPIENSKTTVLQEEASSVLKKPAGPFKINITYTKIYPNAPHQTFIKGTFEGQLKKNDGTVLKITEGHFASE